MRYVNTKTGATFQSPCQLSGGDWVTPDMLPREEAPPETEELKPDSDLEGMTLDELKTLAAELDITFKNTIKKADLIRLLEDAFAEE
jgi:hypothetical protein